ncbi:uncharacterized protein LOC142533704 [Primulina tabacum]|uniref:uncharacterized protein LOC142533704 n=1 Tax=Primulina tabacum TaxID=48773 RepID=UPI003F5906D0
MTELNPINISQQNLEIRLDEYKTILGFCTSSSVNAHEFKLENELLYREEDDELRKLLLVINVEELPTGSPSAVEVNFTIYFCSRLCVIGLVSTHVAFEDGRGIVSVNFNVRKSDRSEIKVSGKRKKNAQRFETNTALCKVCTRDASYIVRCFVKGTLL